MSGEDPEPGMETKGRFMKIAVMSDSHDHLDNITAAVDTAMKRGAGTLVHCGDMVSPFVVDRLANFGGQVHAVFGNNDGDRFTLSKITERFPNVVLHGHIGTIEAGGGLVAFTHYPEFGRGLAATGEYVAVFSGHTHTARSEDVGGVLHLNPGEIMGLLEKPSMAVWDSGTGEVERIVLDL